MIHQYINNGYYIVLDVNSGSVHSVDPLLYDVISFLSERIPDSVGFVSGGIVRVPRRGAGCRL